MLRFSIPRPTAFPLIAFKYVVICTQPGFKDVALITDKVYIAFTTAHVGIESKYRKGTQTLAWISWRPIRNKLNA